MDKKYLKTIVAVVMGIVLITMLYATFSLLFDALLMDNLIIYAGESSHDTLKMVQDMVIALTCVVAVALVCYIFSFLGNGKIFNIVSSVLSLFITATSVAFLFVINKTAFEAGQTPYATVAGYFAELIQLAATAFVAGGYFTVNSVLGFINKKPETAEVTNEEV